MTDYVLKISSYGGLVAGARHYRGRVEGPHPKSCHGAMSYNAPESRGEYTCSEGHEIPGQRRWDVESGWTEERYARWAKKSFEGDGPQQFLDQAKLIEAAVKRFKGELPRNWWEEEPEAGKPGDRLFLDFVARDPAEVDEEWGRIMGTLPYAYGAVLAEVPPEGAP